MSIFGQAGAMQQLDSQRKRLAISLAALAGFVDAIGFLAGGGYFVSFMSGNTTRLAVDIATDPARALVPALLIACFVVGVAAGALCGAGGIRRKQRVLALVALLLGGAAAAGTLGAARAATAGMALAMGALNNVFQREGEVAVGVTYMTGALVRAGQGLAARLRGTGGRHWRDHARLWAGLALGGVAGALAWQLFGIAAEWAACLWCGAVAALAGTLPVPER
jgi:uncharacterized membrane protein YoaK (UPF0700 family)